MAEVISHGVHTPVALPYLIHEGVLPENPGRDLYSWDSYVDNPGDGDGDDIEEQVLWTKDCVAWSQGNVVRNVYRFGLEGEHVKQAALTRFPSQASSKDLPNNESRIIRGYGAAKPTRDLLSSNAAPANLDRALVVLLKTKAHLYFLHGSDHIIDLPFEIAKAFAAPKGLVLQREVASERSVPPTPHVPAAPPNSFFSSQIRPASSYLQSPTLAKSFGASQTFKRSPLGGNARLDTLFEQVFRPAEVGIEDDAASLYTITTPLSDLGVLSYAVQRHRPRTSGKATSGAGVDFEALDPAEHIVYVSNRSELHDDDHPRRLPLMLIGTVNRDTQTFTLWHAWYIEEKSLTSMMKQRAARKAAKAKRRSSFMSTHVATGTATPAARARDGVRESFAAAGPTRTAGDAAQSKTLASSRKPKGHEEEAEMAHQMDPDFQPAASQQTVREGRRISSLNADARGGQHGPSSFAIGGGRRNTSFGGPGERRSLGHRKSRGSTPGSVFSRSLGPDDDLMEVDTSSDIDNDESLDSVMRHVRATYEAAGADGVFGGLDDNFKHELIVQKIHSTAISFGVDHDAARVQLATLRDPIPARSDDQQILGVYVRGTTSDDLICLQIGVKHRQLWSGVEDETTIAIPRLMAEINLGRCGDILKLGDGGFATILSDTGLFVSPVVSAPIPLHSKAVYQAYDGLTLDSTESLRDGDVGENRLLGGPSVGHRIMSHSGAHGSFDEEERDGVHHRRRLKVTASSQLLERLLKVCQLVLPPLQGRTFVGIWMLAHSKLVESPYFLNASSIAAEMMAFVAAVFALVGHLVHERERAALRLSQVACGNTPVKHLSKATSYRLAVLQQSEHGPWQHVGRDRLRDEMQQSPKGASTEHCLPFAAQLADEMVRTTPWLSALGSLRISAHEAASLMLALYVLLQERKLNMLSSTDEGIDLLAVLIAQLGTLLGLPSWNLDSFNLDVYEVQKNRWAFVHSTKSAPPQMPLMDEPVPVFMWFEHAMKTQSTERYPSLSDVVSVDSSAIVGKRFAAAAARLTPRIVSLSDMLVATSGFTTSSSRTVELMATCGLKPDVLETLPSAIAAPFREAIAQCERAPPTAWPSNLLGLVGRDDRDLERSQSSLSSSARTPPKVNAAPRDTHTICNGLEQTPIAAKTKEAHRHAVSQLIFSEDRRLVEATSLMHYNSPQLAECPKQPDWSDAHHFEQQRRVLNWATSRMIALPSGDGMLHFDSQTPLLTEKYHLSGFSNACIMQPMGHTLTADRSGLTEEKVNWAYFHAGVSAGLRITKNAKGLDTSWIAFNKPSDLTNRHAGLLLALGLRGHLRQLAKWLSFKYLTPKHTVTSVGLLLGLSASYMGTMDGLITRMLSVHITRMLPPGAAELNVSAITQTAGLMGIGLLYCNTQHRRMSEIMLSEVEHLEVEDPDSGPDPLRDESYRLAAGFALGFINLGRGEDLRGLSGMQLPERLLAVAVGARPVRAVHVFDRATAGAIIAIALVYMKSGDRSIAQKIDIPDTEAQFDHVRPDMLMLRAMAKHIILWNGIKTSPSIEGMPCFTQRNLPLCYQDRFKLSPALRTPLKSADVPFFNIVTGLVLALSLKYAGSGDEVARDEILLVLDYFSKAKGSGDASFYYDAKLTRATVRRCIDVVALAAATVMAGTGDLKTFRYLRRLHGRTDAETPYGSHLAAHLAIGVLFLAGGTYTFGTSNLAVASLLCAFYPLFPTDVHDNHVHLQAFRHFWVFAAEARCLVVEDIDTQRPISMPIVATMNDGSVKDLTSPCLLPEFDEIATIHTDDLSFWQVTLDFANNPKLLAHFRETQRIFVRRCPPSEAHNTTFTATMAALTDVQTSSPQTAPLGWRSVFDLSSLRDIDKAETELILPPNAQSSVNIDERGTSIDDRLALSQAASGNDGDALWNLRMLFAWAEKVKEGGGGETKWVGREVLDTLKARIEERMQNR